ncbi:cupin domain-containing protein [Hasllibacter sp. MH4015]|uniref:(R)-mandelonitrile lyase n=1 Tax=Hasllibacter sp. MH4015 TaxID=2854029 RepID=UPI001CD7B5FD|nr:cupin domain-containing protein [Hasllibacter sp. MH4015]
MKITRASDMAGGPGPAEYFTGDVTITPLHKVEGPERAGALRVRFEAGARTAWHTHPLGQLLIVTEGEGWVRKEGEAKQVIRPGDTIWFEAGERHWHGATATSAMEHIAVQEAVDGSAADWAEHVADADYLG